MLAGVQKPRVASVPKASASSGPETIDVAAAAGLILDPWQRFVVEGSLGERSDGKWAATEVGLLVPRQNGKGGILEARELAGLFVFGEQLITHTAHELKTAMEAFARILALIEGRDDFNRKIRKVSYAHGEEGIYLKGGQSLRFIARSKGSGRGFTGDLVVIDEAYALTAAQMAALIPTLSARPNPQIWYTSSAGDANAHMLARVRRRGHGRAPRLAFMEWSSPADANLDDRREWARDNPGLGFRITEEFIETERATLEDADFARERLGIWQREARKHVIPEENWNAVQDERATPTEPIRFGIDASPDRTRGSIAAAGGRALELVDNHAGVGWMSDRAVYLAKKWDGVVVVDANGPASSIADEIEKEGVTVERLNGPEFSRACAHFYDSVMNARAAVRSHGVLTAAIGGAVKKLTGDRFVWSRTESVADVTPLIAASLALSVSVSEPDGEDFVFVA